MRVMRRLASEGGMIMPALLLLLVILMGSGLIMFQVGRASALKAEAVTGADAAALAGAENLLEQLRRWPPQPISEPEICAAAADWAARNDTDLVDCHWIPPLDVVASVTSRTIGDLRPDDHPEAADDRLSRAEARARVGFAGLGYLGLGLGVSGNVNGDIAHAIALGQAMGLTVTSTTGGRHAPNSYHYSGQAADFGGPPELLAAFYVAALNTYCDITELFYDPLGGIKHNTPIGAIGGHGTHVHIALTGNAQCGEDPDGAPEAPDIGDFNVPSPPSFDLGDLVRLVPYGEAAPDHIH